MSVTVYLDESGDLGWSFDKPYRNGGSSRYLTIASLVVPNSKIHFPERVIRDLYKARGWSTSKEKKWSSMSNGARSAFVQSALKLLKIHPDISYHVIVVKKDQVKAALRKDENLLYNYMIGYSLIKKFKLFDSVTLVPDPRSIKVQSGNSLHDYLQINLWYKEHVETILTTMPLDSKKTLGLQFVDMLAGLAQMAFEDKDVGCWNLISPHVSIQKLFF